MQQSYVRARFSANDFSQEVGANYPFSAQYKGDAWYVFDASDNRFFVTPYQTAALAEEAAAAYKGGSKHE